MKEPVFELSIREVNSLFRPFLHRKIQLPTRLVMAVRSGHIPSDAEKAVLYYRRRAEHRIGLIISEPIAVNDKAASGFGNTDALTAARAMRRWRQICRSVHATSCKMAAQLWHAGMLRPGADAIGPSGMDMVTGELRCEPVSKARLREVVQAYAECAALTRILGFDAVEINAGSQGLIEQFMRRETNRREDEYGGDAVSRTRLACEILHAVRKALGRGVPIVFRLPELRQHDGFEPFVKSPDTLADVLSSLCAAGVDIFACESRSENEALFPDSALNAAGWIRLLSHMPVMTEGGVGVELRQLDSLARRVVNLGIDLVAVGRALSADAEWGSKVYEAREDAIRFYGE